MSNGPMGGGVSLDAGSLTALQQQMKMQEAQVRLQEKMAGLQAEREEKITEQVLTRAQLVRLDVLRAVAGNAGLPPQISIRRLDDIAKWVLAGDVKKDEPNLGLE